MELDLAFSNGVIEILGLYSKADNIYIGVVYRQPDDPTGGNKSGSTELKSALSKLKQKLDKLPTPTPNLIICGDFNLSHCNWESGEPTSGATKDEKEMLTTPRSSLMSFSSNSISPLPHI
jgi:exonuclease III